MSVPVPVRSDVEVASDVPERSAEGVKYLLSPTADWAMAGGLSLIVFAVCMLFFERPFPTRPGVPAVPQPFSTTVQEISWTMFYLSFLVNFPHFLTSYQLLYWDGRRRLFKQAGYFMVGVIIPLALMASMAYVAIRRTSSVSVFVQLMFVLVGWHYAKQVYGIVVFTSARRKVFYSRFEKGLIQASLFGVAYLSWMFNNTLSRMVPFYGFTVENFKFPAWALYAGYAIFAVSLLSFFTALVVKYVREGVTPPTTSTLAMVSLFIWYLPVLFHPVFMYTVPFFHSLQYLWFAIAFRRNKVREKLSGLEGPNYRMGLLTSFWGYFGGAAVLGALAFYVVPGLLDNLSPLAPTDARPLLFTALFSVFINVHHFFIDSVIWKKGNPEARQYLIP